MVPHAPARNSEAEAIVTEPPLQSQGAADDNVDAVRIPACVDAGSVLASVLLLRSQCSALPLVLPRVHAEPRKADDLVQHDDVSRQLSGY